jgi:hypothetical protein
MKKLKLFALILLTTLVLASGGYFHLSYRGLCFQAPTCTEDVVSLCHPETATVWQGPSSCSCGIDASILKRRGWISCEVPEGYQREEKKDPLVIRRVLQSLPKSLTLFLVPTVFLTAGLGSVIFLWARKEEAPPSKKEAKKTSDNSQSPK